MEILFLIGAGLVLALIVFLSLINIVTNRITTPANTIKEKVIRLEQRLEELEAHKNK